MKARVVCPLVLLLISFRLLGQDQDIHINFTIFIDEKFIIGGVSNGHILFKDSVSLKGDSIDFKYEAGNMMVSHAAFNKLLSLNKRSKIVIKFKYKQICDEQVESDYQKEWQGPLLLNRYIIFKVYNFSNKVNYETFMQRSGYGIEVEIPGYATILPRKKSKRNMRSKCY